MNPVKAHCWEWHTMNGPSVSGSSALLIPELILIGHGVGMLILAWRRIELRASALPVTRVTVHGGRWALAVAGVALGFSSPRLAPERLRRA